MSETRYYMISSNIIITSTPAKLQITIKNSEDEWSFEDDLHLRMFKFEEEEKYLEEQKAKVNTVKITN